MPRTNIPGGMTIKEFRERRNSIRNAAKLTEQHLNREYAFSNNPYKVGDIIEDHMGRIQIETIAMGIVRHNDLPVCVYTGVMITKAGKPYKTGEKRSVWQNNIKTD